MANRVSSAVGRRLAAFLKKQVSSSTAIPVAPTELLRKTLRPGDVLLVEGNTRISGAIEYLTQSTWSHAAFCVCQCGDGDGLIKADPTEGVHCVPISNYETLNTRICRPVPLSPDELETGVAYMKSAIGKSYDLKNVFDLARYLLPQPPVPRRWRRMLSLGSGTPPRAALTCRPVSTP